MFESGAIMWYLAEKDPEHKLWPKVTQLQACCSAFSALLMPRMHFGPAAADCSVAALAQDLAKQADVMSWLMFQMVCVATSMLQMLLWGIIDCIQLTKHT